MLLRDTGTCEPRTDEEMGVDGGEDGNDDGEKEEEEDEDEDDTAA